VVEVLVDLTAAINWAAREMQRYNDGREGSDS
jgi:hypothetical protein